jgi:hypothetical protein
MNQKMYEANSEYEKCLSKWHSNEEKINFPQHFQQDCFLEEPDLLEKDSDFSSSHTLSNFFFLKFVPSRVDFKRPVNMKVWWKEDQYDLYRGCNCSIQL